MDDHKHRQEGKVDDYLQLAAAADNGVMMAEPGMLHHMFDISPDDPQCFTWSEAYLNDAALGAHLTNPAIGVYLEAHAPLCESFEVEVYGTLGEEMKKTAMELPFPVKVFETKLGYSRLP